MRHNTTQETNLEAVSGDGPNLVQPSAEVVAGDDEGLGPDPHGEHDEEGEGPHGQQEELHGEGRGGEGPQDEGHVQRLHHVHHVRQEHEVRHLVHTWSIEDEESHQRVRADRQASASGRISAAASRGRRLVALPIDSVVSDIPPAVFVSS